MKEEELIDWSVNCRGWNYWAGSPQSQKQIKHHFGGTENDEEDDNDENEDNDGDDIYNGGVYPVCYKKVTTSWIVGDDDIYIMVECILYVCMPPTRTLAAFPLLTYLAFPFGNAINLKSLL